MVNGLRTHGGGVVPANIKNSWHDAAKHGTCLPFEICAGYFGRQVMTEKFFFVKCSKCVNTPPILPVPHSTMSSAGTLIGTRRDEAT